MPGWIRLFLIVFSATLLSACKVGPNYIPPIVNVPPNYKEAALPKGWKMANPQDEIDRGAWWEIFNCPELNALEADLNIGNQNIAAAQSQYLQSLAMIDETRAALFPVISGFFSVERQKPPSAAFNTASGTGTGTTSSAISAKPYTTYIASLNASWIPDLWGQVRRELEAGLDTAQASAANVAAVRLSAQALLAEDYFALRTLDALQKVLDDTVLADRKLLKLVRNRFQAGTASLADITTAQATLEAAEAAAINNGVTRAETEHAIAVLTGKPPAEFCLIPTVMRLRPPLIPAQLPSELLERRPDVAKAERTVAAANAQIGVAVAAFFPTLTLTGSMGFQTNDFPKWFTNPSFFWTEMADLMGTIFDAGLRAAEVGAAQYAYNQTVDNYRQTLLTAFQNVEDNLSAQRILSNVAVVQKQAVATAKLALQLTLDDYQAGTVDLTTVLAAQTTLYTAEQNDVTVVGERLTAAVNLIAALGGGWCVTDALSLPPTP